MPIADLPRCLTEEQITEAIAKPVGYAFAPDNERWRSVADDIARFDWSSIFPLIRSRRERSHDRALALKFCRSWGIDFLWAFEDEITGFELVLFERRWRSYLVAIGSNDPTDWRRNLAEPLVGMKAYQANRNAVKAAMQLTALSSELVVCGHSMGGAIAQYIAADYPQVSRCITYQSAAVPPATIAQAEARSINATHWLHPSDPVFPLSRKRCGGGLIPGETVLRGSPVHGRDRLKAHSLMLSLQPEQS